MYVRDRKRLATLMVIQEISIRQMAIAAGWKSHTYLQRLLSGTAKTLKTDPAILIAHTLGVPIEDLFVTQTDAITVHHGRPVRTSGRKGGQV